MVEMVGRQDKMTHWKHDVHSVSRATTTKNVEASATQCRWRTRPRLSQSGPLSHYIDDTGSHKGSDGFRKRPVHVTDTKPPHRCIA